jgi:hypothetical protein
MGSRVRFVTHVTHTLGDKWQWTKPRKTPRESFEAAENMVSARLMEDRSIKRNFENFAVKLRVLFPEIIEEAQAFIGETREVILPENITPKQFQQEFHKIQYHPDYHQEFLDNQPLEEGDE